MLAGQCAAAFDSINAELVGALVQGLHSCLDITALCQRLVAMEGMGADVFLYAMCPTPVRLSDQLTACACLGRLYETAWLVNETCRQKLEGAVVPGGVFGHAAIIQVTTSCSIYLSCMCSLTLIVSDATASQNFLV